MCYNCGTVSDSLVSELNSQLQCLMKVPDSDENCDESKKVLVKAVIEDFIKKSNASREEIRKVVTEIYTELVLSKEIYEWALERIALIPEISARSSPDSPEEKHEVEEPLFCEDTVYHASLCCVVVSTKDSRNYKRCFANDFPNHQFEEVSLSVSRDSNRLDRYLIAKKGKTYFIAFKGEPSFSQWPQLFKSFEQGQLL